MKLVCCFVFFLWNFISALELPPDIVYLAETMNPRVDEYGHKFFEGDMILNKKQQEMFETERKDRAAESRSSRQWPNKYFIYKIANELANVDNLTTAIQNWQNNTCVLFFPANSHKVFAHFKKGIGCSSYVGYQGTEQTISLAPRCYGVGTIEHEIGHALGLFHEHSRKDRDQFVTIIDENVNRTYTSHLNIETKSNSYNISYDVDSILQYGPLSFSTNGENTIVTNNPFDHFRIGQRNGMSFDDIKLVNLLYRCSDDCEDLPICQNDGFVNDYCVCVCPPGTSGTNCENGRRTFPVLDCLHDLNKPEVITSPGFPNSPNSAKCIWRITAPPTQRVRIHFRSFSIGPPLDPIVDATKANWCFSDYLELRLENQIRGKKYCGSQLNKKTLTSISNVAVFVFDRNNLSFPGFQADIQFIN